MVNNQIIKSDKIVYSVSNVHKWNQKCNLIVSILQLQECVHNQTPLNIK